MWPVGPPQNEVQIGLLGCQGILSAPYTRLRKPFTYLSTQPVDSIVQLTKKEKQVKKKNKLEVTPSQAPNSLFDRGWGRSQEQGDRGN